MYLLPHSRRLNFLSPLAATLFLFTGGLSIPSAQASQAPIILENEPGWAGGVIEGNIGGDPAVPQSILVTHDHTLSKGLRVLQPEAKRMYEGLNFVGAAVDGTRRMRTLTLEGPLSVNFGRKGEVNARFDEQITLDFAGGPAVLNTETSDSHLELHGPIRNANGLTKSGASARVYLSSADLGGVTGHLRVDAGWLMIRDKAAMPGINGVTLTGQFEHPAYLAMEGEAVHDRLPDTAPITVSGGAAIVLSGGNEKKTSESIGRVAVRDNALQLEVRGKNPANPVTLTLAELVRDPASLVIVGGEKFGEAAFVKVARDAAILSALKGGGGAAGSTTISIVPWVRGLGGHLDDARGLLTYTHDAGFRELRPEEYVEGLQAANHRADNVRVTATEPPLAKSKTINSLFCDLPKELRHRVVDLGDKTLTITSGALSAEKQTAILGGALTTGNDQALSFVGDFNLNTCLAGKGGAFFFAGDMTVLTNPHNSLRGDWTFAGGRALVSDDDNSRQRHAAPPSGRRTLAGRVGERYGDRRQRHNQARRGRTQRTDAGFLRRSGQPGGAGRGRCNLPR
jgi:hypothetical protein